MVSAARPAIIMNKDGKTGLVLVVLALVLLGLAVAFHFDLWARPPKLPRLPRTG